jgi:hypothetical protein
MRSKKCAYSILNLIFSGYVSRVDGSGLDVDESRMMNIFAGRKAVRLLHKASAAKYHHLH